MAIKPFDPKNDKDFSERTAISPIWDLSNVEVDYPKNVSQGTAIRDFRNLLNNEDKKVNPLSSGYMDFLAGLGKEDPNILMEYALLSLVAERDMQMRNSPINFTDLTTDVSFGDRIASSIQAQRSKRARPQFGIG